MQCNTNYTASLDNLRHIHLNVLKTYAAMYPDVVLGLSDHTPGHATCWARWRSARGRWRSTSPTTTLGRVRIIRSR